MYKIIPAIRDAFVAVPQEWRAQVLADLFDGLHNVIAEEGMLPDLETDENFALVMSLSYTHDSESTRNISSIRGSVKGIVNSFERSMFKEHPELLAMLTGNAIRNLLLFQAKET